jgi:hypothetical protein
MFAKAKRRQAGIYLVRTRKHRGRGRENGYVGRSNNWKIRKRQHLGQDSRHKEKPWADLDPQWHVLRLPWWLSWKWVQAPLEATAILLLAPRYNHMLNLANPRRVPLSTQALQRAERDGVTFTRGPWRTLVTWRGRELAYKTAGIILMLGALAMIPFALTK